MEEPEDEEEELEDEDEELDEELEADELEDEDEPQLAGSVLTSHGHFSHCPTRVGRSAATCAGACEQSLVSFTPLLRDYILYCRSEFQYLSLCPKLTIFVQVVLGSPHEHVEVCSHARWQVSGHSTVASLAAAAVDEEEEEEEEDEEEEEEELPLPPPLELEDDEDELELDDPAGSR